VSARFAVRSEAAGAGRRSIEVTTPFSSIEMSLCFSPPKINSGMYTISQRPSVTIEKNTWTPWLTGAPLTRCASLGVRERSRQPRETQCWTSASRV
jgi:hypothetical protein